MTTFLICLIAFIIFVLTLYIRPTTKGKNLPPSPPRLPIIGNLHQLSPLIHRAYHSLSQRYGRDLMLLHLGSIPTVVVSTVESAREILHTHDAKFVDKPNTETFKKVSFNYREVGLAPYGEYWRQARKMLAVHCLSLKQVRAYRGIRDQETAITLDKIAKLSASNKVVNISDLFAEHSYDMSSRVAFGKKYDNNFRKVMSQYIVAITHFYFADTIPLLGWIDRITGANRRRDEAVKGLDHFLEVALDDWRAKINSEQMSSAGYEGAEPLIDVLVKDKKHEKVDLTLDKDTIKALLTDMYVGGAQTTASFMAWTLLELLAHPNILKKLQTEIRGIVKDKKHITNDEFDQMEYLRAVMMETVRIHPLAPLLNVRVATEDVKVMGYDIAKGTRVYVSVWAIGKDANAWEKPNEFMPERFIGESINYVKHEFKLITFGAGRRNCPGRTFATTVAENCLAHVLCNFDLALPHGMKPDDIDMTETAGIAVHPKFPILVTATPSP